MSIGRATTNFSQLASSDETSDKKDRMLYEGLLAMAQTLEEIQRKTTEMADAIYSLQSQMR